MDRLRCLLLLIATGALASGHGCIGSKTRQCSWGAYCPAGMMCDEGRGLCVTPGQREVCLTLEEGDACTYADAPLGDLYCFEGLCVPQRCGDGVAGGSEQCDDGNTDNGDGCSADCLSDETCGNGRVDEVMGESCDDADDQNHDGCTITCAVELPELTPIWATLPPLFGISVASDAAHGRVVVHGGVSPDTTFEYAAWTFDGSSWARLEADPQPQARMDAGMAYDGSGQRVVLFGGWNGVASLDDTWVLQGDQWQQLSPATSPVGRSGTPLVHDAVRGRVVLFGGELADRTALDTMWALSGDTWQELNPPTRPPARRYHGLAYDAQRGRVVLFGGSYGYPEWVYLGDTWEYNGQTWVQRFPANAPSARDSHSLVWDPARQRVVLFGGSGQEGFLSDTWEYDGQDWQPLTPATVPPARGQLALAVDPTAPRLVMMGGTQGSYQAWDDMWELRSREWSTVTSRLPAARVAPAMTYDEARQRLVLHGGGTGFSEGKLLGDTWEYDGYTWRLRHPTVTPGDRGGHLLVYDSQRQRVVLFGGLTGPSMAACSDEVWEYDGQTWEHRDLVLRPSRRAVTGGAFDPLRGVTVIFGGMCNYVMTGDLWEYDGQSWQEVDPAPDPVAGLPPPRAGGTMTWDSDNEQLLLFGGQTEEGTDLEDVWAYDGTGWTRIAVDPGPEARAGHVFAYNPLRSAATVIGGLGVGTVTDAWELRSHGWLQAGVRTPPPDRYAMAGAYFPPQQAILIFGGYDRRGITLDDFLRYRYEGPTTDEICYGGVDDDGDDLVDCEDPDCDGRPCDFLRVCVFGQCL